MKKLTLLLTGLFLCISVFAQPHKSVSILGDSYSAFEEYVHPSTNHPWYFTQPKADRTDVTSVTQMWWHLILQKQQYRLCLANAFSGATICNRGYRKEDYTDRSFLTRMTDLGCPDIIFILGATNDSWADSPIGEYKYRDWTKEDLFTFRPAMAKMLWSLKNRHPYVEIYFILNSELKKEINESVHTICQHYQIDCIDLRDIDKKNSHPTIKGMQQIANQVNIYINKKQK